MTITADGYVVRSIQEIRDELILEIQNDFPSLSMEPDSFEGHVIDNVADKIYKLEQKLQALYNLTPSTAIGRALDSFAILKGLTRIQETPSIASITFVGTENTVIPESMTIRDIRQSFDYKPVSSGIIDTLCTENKFQVIFNRIPTAGTWSIEIDGVTETYNFDEASPTHSKCSSVTGDYIDGFVFEMSANYGDDLTVESSSVFNSIATLIILELDNLYKTTVTCANTENGAYTSNSLTISEIKTPVTGLEYAYNSSVAIEGTFEETDADFYDRFNEVSGANGNSIEGIKNRLIQIINDGERFDLIKKVIIKEHFGAGLAGAPNPLEIFVSGGDTKGQTIAEVLRLQLVSAGIELLGDEDYTVLDSDSFPHNSKFSRVEEILVYLNLELEVNDDYPGDAVIKDAIVQWGNKLDVGQDVIRIPGVVNALCKIPGITNIPLIELSTDGMTFSEDNIVIQPYQESKWLLENITITGT